MTALKLLTATAVLITPLFLTAAPAEAYTARQYQEQGRGHYTSSKGHTYGYSRYRSHRSYRYRRY